MQSNARVAARYNEIEAQIAALRALIGGGGGEAVPTTFVFRPGGVAGENVYTSWPALFAAASVVNGPRFVEFDNSLGACVIPAGAWNFGAWNVTFRGLGSSGSPNTPVTIQTGASFVGVNRIDQLGITYQGAAPGISLPTTSQVTIYFTGQSTVVATGGAPFVRAPAGATGFVFLFDDSLFSGGATVADAAGAGATLIMLTFDEAVIGATTIGASGGGTILVFQESPASGVSLTQTPALVWGSTLTLGVGPGLRNLASTDAASTVPPAPANQTTPGANTDVLAAILTPHVSGRFRVKCSLEMTATATDTLIVTVVSRTKAATMVVANGTATGLNCFFATANGPITYGGGTTDLVRITKTLTVPAAPVTWEFVWANLVNGTAAGAGFTLGNNTAFAVCVQDAAHNVTAMTGSISAEEVLYG